MLQIEKMSKSYSDTVLFRELTFQIASHERCAFVGRNGSGKTTILKILAGIEGADAGTIIVPKHYKIGYLAQYIDFKMSTVLDEAMSVLPQEQQEASYRAEKILFGLGFKEEELSVPPGILSGGFHLRLHLTKLLLSDPDCLLLDEPTNYLDIVSIRWLESFLKGWRKELIVISHDVSFLNAVSTHTMGLHRGAVIKAQGGTEAYYAKLVQAEEIHERTRVKLNKKRNHMMEFVSRFRAKASKAAQAQSRLKAIEKMPYLEQLCHLDDLEFAFNEVPFHGKVMLKAENVCFSYLKETVPLINAFNLEVHQGEKIAVIGKNGKGKSTLLKLLMCHMDPQKGTVVHAPQVKVGYFGQTHISQLSVDATVEEEISDANPLLPKEKVRAICGSMLFSQESSQKKIKVLSGGEKSRVLLGKILAMPCNLLVLDEPTHHLDIESVESLINALEHFSGAVIMVSHSENILKRLNPHRLIICDVGQQEIFEGDYEDFLIKKGWDEEKVKTEKKGAGVEYRHSKHKRALIIQARSKELKPLEKTISQLELDISQIELAVQQIHQEMAQAASRSKGALVTELAKKLTGEQQRQQKLLNEWENAMDAYGVQQAVYQKQLDALNEG